MIDNQKVMGEKAPSHQAAGYNTVRESHNSGGKCVIRYQRPNTFTCYVRDAQGNVLSVYVKTGFTANDTQHLYIKEHHLYGSSFRK